MTENRTETAKRFLGKELDKLSEQERQVVDRFISRGRVARNVAHEFKEQMTFAADRDAGEASIGKPRAQDNYRNGRCATRSRVSVRSGNECNER